MPTYRHASIPLQRPSYIFSFKNIESLNPKIEWPPKQTQRKNDRKKRNVNQATTEKNMRIKKIMLFQYHKVHKRGIKP